MFTELPRRGLLGNSEVRRHEKAGVVSYNPDSLLTLSYCLLNFTLTAVPPSVP